MNVKDYATINKNERDYMIANQNKINDFNEGSVISTIFESVARVVEELYTDCRNGFNQNLKTMAYSVFNFKAKEGQKATTTVTFSCAKPINQDTIISSGTKVSSNGLNFITTEEAVIQKNETTSNAVGVQAENIGSSYNVDANTITSIESIVPQNIASVTNANAAVGGIDEESESETMARFKTHINGLQGTNKYGLESAILSLEGVKDCSLIEKFPPEQDIYNAIVYIDDGSGGLTEEIKNKILNIIEGDGTSVNPGYRAAGINIDVRPANVIPIDVIVSVTKKTVDKEEAIFQITKTVQDYINSLSIGENVVLTTIILKLRQLSFISDVGEIQINGENKNVVISKDSIGRFNSIDVTLE